MLRPLLFASTLLALAGCAGAPERTPAAAPARPSAAAPVPTVVAPEGGGESGFASYYADSLKGRPTASGEPYDPQKLTAAHRTLPFGTIVEVSREDGTSVTVRINDRGPFAGKNRIVDLSRKAAEALGMIRAGVVPVTLRVKELAPAKPRRKRR